MHLLRRLRGDKALQRLPELRRRIFAAADPPSTRMASGSLRGQAGAVGQAGASEISARRHRRALRADQEYSAARAVGYPHGEERWRPSRASEYEAVSERRNQ